MARRLRHEAIPRDPVKAEQLAHNFLNHFSALDPAWVVSGTCPIHHEMDPSVLMRKLADRGHRLCLPVLTEKYSPLKFRLYAPGDALVTKTWGLQEPVADAPEVMPDVLLVPLLAFDRQGQRLGYGAGYFDATLSLLRKRGRVLAVGFGHALQEVPLVPATSRDQRLDVVVTEREVILPITGPTTGQGMGQGL